MRDPKTGISEAQKAKEAAAAGARDLAEQASGAIEIWLVPKIVVKFAPA